MTIRRISIKMDRSFTPEENQECHKDIMDLTEKITDSIVYRTVSLEKENRYILNCAIERRNHRVDS